VREREERNARNAAPALEATAGVGAGPWVAASSSASIIVIGTRRRFGFSAGDPGKGAMGKSSSVCELINILKIRRQSTRTVRGAGLSFARSPSTRVRSTFAEAFAGSSTSNCRKSVGAAVSRVVRKRGVAHLRARRRSYHAPRAPARVGSAP
jgi:hypothetical protein